MVYENVEYGNGLMKQAINVEDVYDLKTSQIVLMYEQNYMEYVIVFKNLTMWI